MLTVSTYLDRSQVHGIGLFSKNIIPKGNTVWEFNPLIDLVFTLEDWEALRSRISPHSFRNLVTYSYKEKGCLFLCQDNAQFMNHSRETANVIQDPRQDLMYAGRRIEAGEELLCNYFEFSDEDDIHARSLAGLAMPARKARTGP